MRKLLIITALLAAASAFGRPSAKDQQFLPDLNLLNNPGFESKTAQWEATGGSLGTTSVASNVYEGIRSAVWDPSASGQFMRSRLNAATMPKGLEGRLCQLSFWYTLETGATGDIVARVHDGTSAISADFDLAPAPAADGFQSVSVYFDCPAQGTNIRAELESTADADALTIDGVHLGSFKKAVTNVLPVVFEQTDDVTTFGVTGNITHNKNVPEADQIWSAVVQQSGLETLLLDNGWITDMADNQIFYDFTGLNAADVVTIKMADSRQFSHLVENSARNFIYGPSGTAPATTLPHGLGSVPVTVIVQHEQVLPGRWTDIGSGNYCDVDATNLYCTFPGSMTIDATHRIRIGVSSAVNVAFFDGSVDQLGVGTNANDGFDPNANEVVIYDGVGTAGMTIATQTSSAGRINFQDNAGAIGSGNIKYQSSNNQLSFGTGSVEDKAVLDADGEWGVGTTAPVARGHFRDNGGVITGLNADTTLLTQKSQAAGDNSFMSAVAGTTGSAGYYMGPVDNADEGAVFYDANGQNLTFRSNDATRAFFNSVGNLQFSHPTFSVDGTNLLPSYAFTNHNDTGLYACGGGELCWSHNGAKEMELNTNFLELTTANGLRIPAGSAAAPTVHFPLSTTSGLYSPGTNQVGISTNGTARLTFSATGQATFANSIRATAGAASDPSYGFSADSGTNTGMYRISEDIIGFATNGTERVRIDTDSLDVNNASGNATVNIISGTSSLSILNMGDTTVDDGQMRYDNSTRTMLWKVADNLSMELKSQNSGASQANQLDISGGNAATQKLELGDTDLSDDGAIQYNNSSRTLQFKAADTVHFYIESDGGLFAPNMATGSHLAVSRENSGELVRASSSKRYKHDIADATVDTSKVYDLRLVEFKWNRNGRGDIGLVAEESLNLLPYFTVLNDDGQPEGVRYDMLALYMLPEMKKLRDKTVILEAENAMMKAWICEQADAPLALCPAE